jgi:hypothetical protein
MKRFSTNAINFVRKHKADLIAPNLRHKSHGDLNGHDWYKVEHDKRDKCRNERFCQFHLEKGYHYIF